MLHIDDADISIDGAYRYIDGGDGSGLGLSQPWRIISPTVADSVPSICRPIKSRAGRKPNQDNPSRSAEAREHQPRPNRHRSQNEKQPGGERKTGRHGEDQRQQETEPGRTVSNVEKVAQGDRFYFLLSDLYRSPNQAKK